MSALELGIYGISAFRGREKATCVHTKVFLVPWEPYLYTSQERLVAQLPLVCLGFSTVIVSGFSVLSHNTSATCPHCKPPTSLYFD